MNQELTRLHNAHKAYSVADDMFHKIESFNKTESYMNVSSMFEVFGSKSSKKDMNDLATLLEGAGYKRNARKQFLICTEYEAPLYKFKSTRRPNSVIDFTDSNSNSNSGSSSGSSSSDNSKDSDESEDIMDMLDALA